MKTSKKTVVSNAFYGKVKNSERNMSELLEGFLEYVRFELNFSPQTIVKYGKNLEYFIWDIGDEPVE